MSRKQTLIAMRDLLLERREALRQAVNGDDSLLRELEQRGGDVADFALETAYGELSSKLAEVESRELQNVEKALKLMDEGAYGKCECCKRNIPLARLQALPYASACIDCQRAAEERGHRPGDVIDWSQILDTGDVINDVDVNFS